MLDLRNTLGECHRQGDLGLETKKCSCVVHFCPPQLLWSPWTPLGQEGSCSSGQLSSLASYTTFTARRNPFNSAWGVEMESEE